MCRRITALGLLFMVMSTMAALGASGVPDCCVGGFCPAHRKPADATEYCPHHAGGLHPECVRDISKAPEGPILAITGLPHAILIKATLIVFNTENAPLHDSHSAMLIETVIDSTTPPPRS